MMKQLNGAMKVCLVGSVLITAVTVAVAQAQPVAIDSANLTRIDIVLYVDGTHSQTVTAPVDSSTDGVCYSLICPAAVPWAFTLNPSNAAGLTEDFITNAIWAAARTWNMALCPLNTVGFGTNRLIDYTAPQWPMYDSSNTIAFVDWGAFGVLAETSLYASNSPPVGILIEFDTIFNTAYAWGDATKNPGVFDLQGVAVHELGHALGLGDVTDPCFDVAMYLFTSPGETTTRTLASGDVEGLEQLYGNCTDFVGRDCVGDGIPDAWRQQYFDFGGCGGRTNGQSCVSCDADGTGQNNLFKYVAGLDPTNPSSVFQLRVAPVPRRPTKKPSSIGQAGEFPTKSDGRFLKPWQHRHHDGLPNEEELSFGPIATSRMYTVQSTTNLVGGTYANLICFGGPVTNGNQVTISDTNAVEPQKFYRIKITYP